MKYTSINISYVALNVLIDITVENRTISLGKDSTINSSGIFKDKIKISILKVGDSLHYWTTKADSYQSPSYFWSRNHWHQQQIRAPTLSWPKFKYISNNQNGLIHKDLWKIMLHVGTNNRVESYPKIYLTTLYLWKMIQGPFKKLRSFWVGVEVLLQRATKK